jgi:hypothetical protein
MVTDLWVLLETAEPPFEKEIRNQPLTGDERVSFRVRMRPFFASQHTAKAVTKQIVKGQ